MMLLAKLILDSLHGVDPRVFLVPVCLGLGACFIVVLADLEKTRQRWVGNAMKLRSGASQSAAEKDQDGEAGRPKRPN